MTLPTVRHSAALACVVLGLVGIGVQLGIVAYDTEKHQWDFRSYYYATRAYATGANPYHLQSLRELGKEGPHWDEYHPFLYPPYCLLAFRPLGQLPYTSAYYTYLLMKAIALVGMAALAVEWLRSSGKLAVLALLALLGFNGALALDLRSGNVATFEAAFLLSAFAFYMRRNRAAFVILALLAAAFKLLPAAFMGLLVFAGRCPKWRYGLAPVAAVALLVGLSWIVDPTLTRGFLEGVDLGLPPHGALNANLLNLVVDGGRLLGARADAGILYVAYGLVATAVVAVFLMAARALVSRSDKEAGRLLLSLAVLTYGVAAPRLATYSYVLFLVPVAHVLMRIRGWPGTLLLAACVTPALHIGRFILGLPEVPAHTSLSLLPWTYFSWFTLAGVWVAAVVHCWPMHGRILIPDLSCDPASGRHDEAEANPMGDSAKTGSPGAGMNDRAYGR